MIRARWTGLSLGLLLIAATAPLSRAAEPGKAWPAFRGEGSSLTRAANLPLQWDSGALPAGSWQIALPGYGQSSPVVWDERVYVMSVAGETKQDLHLLALELQSGKEIWHKQFAGTQAVKASEYVSRGAPTPAVDAERIYALFESGDLVATTHAGEVLWQRSIVKDYGEFQGNHGFSSSPVLADGNVLVQVCHSGPSYLLALDAATGETAWKTDHPSQTGWSSPAVYRHQDVTGVVVSASGSARAYDVATGKELWFVTGIQGNTVASPTVVDDLVIIGSGGERSGGGEGRRPGGGGNSNTQPQEAAPTTHAGSLAIRLGGHGDVTETHVAWWAPKVTTGFCSPVATQGLVYFVNKAGVAFCVDLATGEEKWNQRLPGSCWASPVAHGDYVTFFCKDGAVLSEKIGPEFTDFVESRVDAEGIVYGVAAVENAWIVRTGSQLTCITGR